MSKPQPPTPPNPTTVAQAQTGTNLTTAIGQQTLNNTNRVTPFGSTTFSPSGAGYTDPTTGQFVPQYTETTTLDPALQNVVNTLNPTAQTLAKQANKSLTTPLDPTGVNNTTIQGGPQALDKSVTDAAFNAQYGFLSPVYAQQQQDLQDQLSRQGIPLGSLGYGNAETQLANAQNQGVTAAANNAVVTGASQANNMYNLALQGQNQQLGQQQLLQTNPLSKLSALYGGAMPTTG